MAKMGRPKIEWDEKDKSTFEGLCRLQCTAVEICDVMMICEETLNRLIRDNYNLTFSEAIKKYGAKGKVALRRYQFELSKKSAAMAIWLGKQYLGQREPEQEIKMGDLSLFQSIVSEAPNPND